MNAFEAIAILIALPGAILAVIELINRSKRR
jgi:hypothetical protein